MTTTKLVQQMELYYQALYVHRICQIHYLFEDRLSDKLYFCIFTHVVFVLAKTKLQHESDSSVKI